jgi:hypothetical protein
MATLAASAVAGGARATRRNSFEGGNRQSDKSKPHGGKTQSEIAHDAARCGRGHGWRDFTQDSLFEDLTLTRS